MKKIIALLTATFLLSGCASMNSDTNNLTPGNPANGNTSLATGAINDAMTPSDRDKLSDFVATAKPVDTVTVQGEHRSYEFISTGIHINSQGQPCREYEIKTKIYLRDKEMSATACRVDAENWKRI